MSHTDTDLLEVSVIIRDAAGKQIASGKIPLVDVNSNVVIRKSSMNCNFV